MESSKRKKKQFVEGNEYHQNILYEILKEVIKHYLKIILWVLKSFILVYYITKIVLPY